MQRRIEFEEGEFYHVYNRGVDKRKIFFSQGDWVHFQRLLHICNNADGTRIRTDRLKTTALKNIQPDETLVNIIAYAMMTNHFHLLLQEKVEGGISKYMRKLLTAYSMYMNTKYDRTGPLMCRPFRAKHVDSDEYFRWLVSYIHLNPVDQLYPDWKETSIPNKQKAMSFIRDYQYSSYPDYFDTERDASIFINKDVLPTDIADLEDISTMLEAYTSLLGEVGEESPRPHS